MKVLVIKAFPTAKGNIQAGAIIDIPENMVDRLKGKVEPLTFDSSRWLTEIKNLADWISAKDPGGDCWQWIKENMSDLWKDHLAADMAVDKAYQEQNAEKIGAAITRTRATFAACLEAWQNRQTNQPTRTAA